MIPGHHRYVKAPIIARVEVNPRRIILDHSFGIVQDFSKDLNGPLHLLGRGVIRERDVGGPSDVRSPVYVLYGPVDNLLIGNAYEIRSTS